MTYDEALPKLQDIVKELEAEEAISIDDYKAKASEAKTLIDFCRSQLTSIEEEIQSVFGETDQ